MWKEGQYIDLWSLVHFLFGVLFVFLADFFELTFLNALIILTVSTTIWELVEFASGKAKELFFNKVADVVVADIGFLFMYILLLINNVGRGVYMFIFSLIAVIFVVLNINGWNHHIKKLGTKQNN